MLTGLAEGADLVGRWVDFEAGFIYSFKVGKRNARGDQLLECSSDDGILRHFG